MPRIKSSSSLFSHKSKFRFSGRCESELIASQSYRSTTSLSPKVADSLNTTQNSNSFERSATLNYPGTFKRRTFITTFRPTGSRHNTLNTSSSDTEQKPVLSDSNNNNLKQKTDHLDISQSSSNAAMRKNTLTNISETSSTNTQQTAIINPDPVDNDLNQASMNELTQQPNLTSTPQTIAKQLNNLETAASAAAAAANQTDQSDQEEKFYDHDDIVCQEPKVVNDVLSKPIVTNYEQITRISLKKTDNKYKYLNYMIILTCVGMIAYWFFFSTPSNSSILTRITNNFYFIYQYLKFKIATFLTSSTYSQSLSSPRWVQWPLVTSNSTIDPLISWFLTKYRPN